MRSETTIAIARRVRAPIGDAAVRRVIRMVLASQRREGAMSVALVSAQQMRRLNRAYHGEDRATDVLAFSGNGEQTDAPSARPAASHSYLGELILCPSVAKQNARRAGEPWRRECIRLLIHGTLHLLGFDHDTPAHAARMFTRQEQLIEQ